MDYLCYFCLVLLCFHARLFVDALWSPAGGGGGGGLASWSSFVMSDCDVVTFPLVSWVKCGSWLCPVLTFALFLTLYLSISNDIFSTCQCPTLDGDVLNPMESISLNSFVLLDHLTMVLTLTFTINC